MTKTANNSPKLSLCVQYGIAAPELPRWRLRRWALAAITAAKPKRIDAVSLTIRLVGRVEGRALNHSYRHKDYATNVLTFGYEDMLAQRGQPRQIMADIIICTPVLKDEALAQGKAYLHHAAHLVVHGALHALGHDHLNPKQAAVMESLETQILAKWAITDPY
jgi:probable rRNA maturation factor